MEIGLSNKKIQSEPGACAKIRKQGNLRPLADALSTNIILKLCMHLGSDSLEEGVRKSSLHIWHKVLYSLISKSNMLCEIISR